MIGLQTRRLVIVCALSASIAPALGHAWNAGPASLTPEQAVAVRRPSDLRWSPDGSKLAFTLGEPPIGAERQSHIWVFDAATGLARQFTSSAKSERHPRWSPDGTRLAFLSNRAGESQQVYLIPLRGGEARQLTNGKQSIEGFEWSPDGAHLACLAPDPKTDDEEAREKNKNDARVVDRDDKPQRLWIADAESGALKRLVGAPWKLTEIEWLPDGTRLVAVGTDHPEIERPTNRIVTVQVADGAIETVAAPRGPFGDLRVSDDGTRAAFVGSRVDGPSPHDLFVLSLKDGQARNLTAAGLDRPVRDYHWRADGSFLVLAESGFRETFWTVKPTGAATALGGPGMAAGELAVSRSGDEWFVGEHADQLPELWVQEGTSRPEVRTSLNAALSSVRLVAPEIFHYTTFDGKSIEGALVRPPASDPGTRLPTIVLVHGGPTGAWRDTFEPWGQLLAAAGYAVFYPNVRGSTGYGFDFLALNRGDWGGGDFKDLMAGVDDLVRRGVADPDRLGIGGWSYGGYMASWAITQTTRFKAAITGAGLSDLAAEFGTEDDPAYDEWFYGLPYEQPDGFRRSSPLTYIKSARTPTLILQGESDVIDPAGQSQALYRALKRYGVETELVLYPREGHGLREQQHLLDRLRRVVAWYDRHLKPAQ
jgi:dipeptidyl aminopeptidase/acylaminoacyl peptidase